VSVTGSRSFGPSTAVGSGSIRLALVGGSRAPEHAPSATPNDNKTPSPIRACRIAAHHSIRSSTRITRAIGMTSVRSLRYTRSTPSAIS
jgi:hypothetical protein